jgi:hypothetical protein
MLVLVEDAAEAGPFSYVEAGDLVWIAHLVSARGQGAGVGDAVVRPMGVVEILELSQCVEQVPHTSVFRQELHRSRFVANTITCTVERVCGTASAADCSTPSSLTRAVGR